MKEKIRSFVTRALREEVGDDSDLVTLGVVHSLFLVQLLVFLEKEAGIEIDFQKLLAQPAITINGLAELVSQTNP